MECLSLRLSKSVNNTDLFRPNDLIVKKKSEEESTFEIMPVLGKTVLGKVEIPQDGVFVKSGTSTKNISGWFADDVLSVSTISFNDKRNIKQIVLSKHYSIDSRQFQGCTELQKISFINNAELINPNLSFLNEYFQPNILTNISLDTYIEGNIVDVINYFPNLIYCNFSNNATITNIYGDLSKINDDLKCMVRFPKKNLHAFSWESERPSSYKIISMIDCYLGKDIDKMLINQSKCLSEGVTWDKIISVKGESTYKTNTEVQEAIEILKSKGYYVLVVNI